ncbi:hypothetical protein HDU98_008954 [Podochytrium sp. JEL0797]|nr:hypothetical protein HDU98_008954 [Podochytrium sp. JEL0797]
MSPTPADRNRALALDRIARTAPAAAALSSLPPSTTPSTITPAISANPSTTLPPGSKRKGLNLDYCDFNLETMTDTRGGFLLQDESNAPDSRFDQQQPLSAPAPTTIPLPADQSICTECQSVDLCVDLYHHYKVTVCRKCRDEFKDKYALLTKTECREDYLLTDSELRDVEKLPYWVKKNPHKDTYANMLLYLRMHVEQFAIQKWGSLTALDEEFARREAEKTQRKKKKFESKLTELRKKTLTSTWRRPEKAHVHVFGDKVALADGCTFEQTCGECGLVESFEEF